ncbi:leucine--tRNA ligase [Candidatus Woesearchaeota archaeon]|nr:leucine--tRNA ligase [Candidatus Woesearchaeota archaeon]
MVDFRKTEKKWQDKWDKKKLFQVKKDKNKKKYYVLVMFPYPSGSGLHMGHAFNYIVGDIIARYKKMQGFNVLHPMGYDSLGLPAENAAIKQKEHPGKYSEKAIKNFMDQQKSLGISYDWSRTVETHSPEYYKWDQWIFLKMLEKGLAYQKESSVNWCPECKTVLANEQVHDGKCWRHEDTNVEIKQLKQWFLRITDYADELYESIDSLKGWPERTKAMQKNWIGKSHGTEIDFEIENPNKKKEISNVVIIHGSPHSKKRAKEEPQNKAHWISWLKKELEKQEIKVYNPLMPNCWKPKYEEWKKEFEKININEDSVLIGHSAGGAFVVRWLKETGKKINKLILISAGKTTTKENKRLHKFYSFNIGDKIKNNVKETIIFISDDEPDYRKKNAIEYEKKLNGKLISLKNRGHFTLKGMKTKEFPELLDEIISKTKFPIFTTRPDTIYGVTFMVISAQHPKLVDLITKEQEKEVKEFLKKLKSVSEKEMEDMEKEGVFTGSFAVNPMTNEKIPVYAGNFVLADYGSGMVMAVPAHDQRDFEFAKKYNIPVKIVIQPDAYDINPEKMSRAYTGNGRMVNSGEFNNLPNNIAIDEITKYLIKKKSGRKTIQYKLKDWCISRQRYWGTPIPVIYCDKCGIVPVAEKDLPVKLPEKVKFGKGNPLETNKDFVNVKCPRCKGNAKRETDTMDTFVNSSWYFLRYCDPENNKKIFDKEKAKYWMPVDQYIGGAEHACMHLIYFRFYNKFLRDIGLVDVDEPAVNLFHQGMLHGPDGKVMSKSRGNVVLPKEVSEKYGIDTARLFLVSIGSPDKDREWNEKGIRSSLKFIEKVYDFVKKFKENKSSPIIESKLHKAIKTVSQDIENFRYNLAVIKLRKLFEGICDEKNITKKDLEIFLKMLAPFCPHICEELWEKLGNKGFISEAKWPGYDDKKINEKALYSEELVDNVRKDILEIIGLIGKDEKGISEITIYIADEWKYGLYKEIKKAMEKTQDINEIMKAVMKTEFRKYGKYISKNMKTMVNQMPSMVTSAKEEKKVLENSAEKITDFKCSVIIKYEKEAGEKANKRALPGKPAIVIE